MTHCKDMTHYKDVTHYRDMTPYMDVTHYRDVTQGHDSPQDMTHCKDMTQTSTLATAACSIAGIKNARVLPVPVLALASRSTPESAWVSVSC